MALAEELEKTKARLVTTRAVVLDIGNPSYATYNGFELTAEWPVTVLGPGPSEKRRTKTQSFTADLKPGSWNRVERIVAPFDNPRDLIGLTMTTDRVSLIKPSK